MKEARTSAEMARFNEETAKHKLKLRLRLQPSATGGGGEGSFIGADVRVYSR